MKNCFPWKKNTIFYLAILLLKNEGGWKLKYIWPIGSILKNLG